MQLSSTLTPAFKDDRAALSEHIADVARVVTEPTASQARTLLSLDELKLRLRNDRLQLAVVGQFKRGKSTLLNALLGGLILPTAVTPLTTIPTFVHAVSRYCAQAFFLSGATKEIEADGPSVRVGACPACDGGFQSKEYSGPRAR